MNQSHPKLKGSTRALMLSTALFYDALTVFIPTFVGVVYPLHYILWFKLNGIPLLDARKMISGTLGLGIELFPLTSFLPACTASIWYITRDINKRGQSDNKEDSSVVGSIRPRSQEDNGDMRKAA